MSEQDEALRMAQLLAVHPIAARDTQVGNCLRRQHAEIAHLTAQRDALKLDVERHVRTVSELEAERDALLEALAKVRRRVEGVSYRMGRDVATVVDHALAQIKEQP